MKIQLAPNFYTKPSIETMLEQFSEYLTGSCTLAEEMHLELNVRDEFCTHSVEIINSFLNNILELTIQDVMINEG